MRPRDLKSIFDVKSLLPIWKDQIFLIPSRFTNTSLFSFPKWEEIFGNENPVSIEFCSGNGDWIAKKAAELPQKNWVAVEMRFDRIQKIWAKLKNNQLKNLVGVCSEALTFSRLYIPNQSVEEVYINFPDPWPKRRHEKHRLMQTPFIEELSRFLKLNGTMTFVTDDFDYLQFSLKKLLFASQFQPKVQAPYFSKLAVEYGSSWFESLWRERGKDIYFTEFEKQA